MAAPLRFALDVRPFTARRAGIGRYVEGLLEGLRQLQDDYQAILYGNVATDWTFIVEDERLVRVDLGPPNPTWHLKAAARLRADRPDVFHSPSSALVASSWPERSVITVHDLAPLTHTETTTLKTRVTYAGLSRALTRVAGAIAVSSATADDLVRWQPRLADRTTVIPEAAAEAFTPGPVDPAVTGLDGPYLLSVGTLEPRKNLARLVEAYRLAAGDDPAFPPLVLVGGQGWHMHDFLARLGSEPDPRIRLTGYVSEARLVALYRGATAFVYPSLFEGFGLPVLEAMSCGAPVITSTTSSLPEVAGDAAILIPPTDVQALATSLREVVRDERLREQLRAKGLLRAATFSWRRAAAEHLAVYRRIADLDGR